MPSFCAAHKMTQDSINLLGNPDAYTSAGLVAHAYPRFRTQFWLDRVMLWLTVFIPMAQAAALIVLHAVAGVARCVSSESGAEMTAQGTNFIDHACGLHLSSQVLKGLVRSGPVWDTNGAMQFQHECYPFILLITAFIMLVPELIYKRAVDRTARRDMCLVRSELHSFRRAIGQELQYLQSISAHSLDSGVPANTLFSPGSTIPQVPLVPQVVPRFPPTGPPVPHAVYLPNEINSGRTTAATVGENSLLSQTPAPTVVQVPSSQVAPPPMASLPTTHRCGLLAPHATGPTSSPVAVGYGDADFSAPGLVDLPCFHACHADWSLNTYLSSWQCTDFYWRRYLTKHAVLCVFQLIELITLVSLTATHHGALFAALFHCELSGTAAGRKHMSICTLQTTFLLNMSVLSWIALVVVGLVLQAVYFYTNFVYPFWLSADRGRYLGMPSRSRALVLDMDETYRCFFADYIHLLAYTAFRDSQCEIRSLSVSYSPGLYRSDFHFISLLCTENAHLIPDAIHIHFWTERYARLCRRRFRRPYWAIRRGSLGHLVRCEDLSMKFNFSKIRIKVEVNDFGF